MHHQEKLDVHVRQFKYWSAESGCRTRTEVLVGYYLLGYYLVDKSEQYLAYPIDNDAHSTHTIIWDFTYSPWNLRLCTAPVKRPILDLVHRPNCSISYISLGLCFIWSYNMVPFRVSIIFHLLLYRQEEASARTVPPPG